MKPVSCCHVATARHSLPEMAAEHTSIPLHPKTGACTLPVQPSEPQAHVSTSTSPYECQSQSCNPSTHPKSCVSTLTPPCAPQSHSCTPQTSRQSPPPHSSNPMAVLLYPNPRVEHPKSYVNTPHLPATPIPELHTSNPMLVPPHPSLSPFLLLPFPPFTPQSPNACRDPSSSPIPCQRFPPWGSPGRSLHNGVFPLPPLPTSSWGALTPLSPPRVTSKDATYLHVGWGGGMLFASNQITL